MREDVRRLVLMRHAKAEAVAATDHDRGLVARGKRDAAEAGRWALGEGVLPEHVFVSAAARTHETWTAFSEAAGLDLDPQLDAGLYTAGPDSALELFRTAPASARTVMVVGHNPTMADLVHLLDDGSADPTAFTLIGAGFPTSAVAVLEVPGEWTDLAIGGGRIALVHLPDSTGRG